MKKSIIRLKLILSTKIIWILFTTNLWAAPVPLPQTGHEFALDLRLFKKIEKFMLMSEFITRQELTGMNFKRQTLGSYYKINRNFKTGLFFMNESGVLHDEDWKRIDGRWQWQDTANRQEQNLLFDLTYASDLPLENFVFEWKNRLVRNFSENKSFLRTRPGLTYIWWGEEAPMVNLFCQYELYLPLNYGRKTVYERWLYLGALFHLHENFLLGPYYSTRIRFWSNPHEFSVQNGNEYETKFKSHFWGLTLDFIF